MYSILHIGMEHNGPALQGTYSGHLRIAWKWYGEWRKSKSLHLAIPLHEMLIVELYFKHADNKFKSNTIRYGIKKCQTYSSGECCCVDGSSRIGIILPDPDSDPYPFQSKVKLYTFPKNFITRILTYWKLRHYHADEKDKTCQTGSAKIFRFPTCVKLGVGSVTWSASNWKVGSGSRSATTPGEWPWQAI